MGSHSNFVSCKSLTICVLQGLQLPRSGCSWLFASSRRRTMMLLLLLLQYRIHCCMFESTAACPSTASGRDKQKHVLFCDPPRAWAREKACSSKIKLILVVRVDATHHSTGPTCLPLNLAERPTVYNIFASTSNIYPPQIKIYIPVLTR